MKSKTNSLKIALADDDADDQFLFQLALKEASGESALEIYNNGARLMEALLQPGADLPHVIFLDMNMPRKNGLQCLEEIRRHESLQHIPVVVLTTSINQAEIKKVYETGANLYFRKPSEFPKLVALIEKVCTMDLTSKGQMAFN
ncbi:response regulator [Paraflavisolibacter sp. H34]|uniref:response regulator n=1 Tax=Huijunlia imazamoxiresistens TaxID=3127457 RepID=UPI00301874FD